MADGRIFLYSAPENAEQPPAEKIALDTSTSVVGGYTVHQLRVSPSAASGSATEAKQDTANNALATLNTSRIAVAAASFTRPNNNTTYTSGDIVADATTGQTMLTFAVQDAAGRANGCIKSAKIIDGNNAATYGEFELWLFSTTWAMQADNVAAAPSVSELANLIAVIPLYTSYLMNSGAGNTGVRVYESNAIDMPFISDEDAQIYGNLVVRNGYTPVALESFTVILQLETK